MRILYIDHYAGSPTAGMEYRPHAMALEWAKLGAETTILAGTYSHLRKRNFEDVDPGRPIDVDGVPFRFLRTRSYEGNGLGRLLSWADFVGGGLRRARAIADATRPDVVIASSTYPFDTWLAAALARHAGAGLVHEIHDLWPLTPIELGGHSPHHPLMWAMGVAERWAYRHSRVIVSILPNTEPHVRSLGIDTPVIHIPNGIDVDQPHAPAPADFVARIDALRKAGRRIIGYAGGMTTANAMDDFVEAMGLLTDEPVTAVLLGDGLLRPDLEQRAARLGAHIDFAGSLPKAQVHEALSLCDALYIGSKRSPLYEYGVSANKIFDYMLTGVPIVDAFASQHSPLAYSGAAVRARAEDPHDIARAIVEATNLPDDERARLAQASIAWVREHHSLPALAERFLTVLRVAA